MAGSFEALRWARVAFAVALSLAMCTGCAPTAEAPERAAPRVLFDVGHGEIFGPDDTTPMGQSAAVGLMREAGFEVDQVRDRFTAENLQGAAGVFLAGPVYGLTIAEQDALEGYVREGGTVVFTVHIPFPHIGFAERFRVRLTTEVVNVAEPKIGADPGVLVAGGTGGELADGVRAVTVLSGWAVEPEGEDSARVVWTGADTRVDGDDDGRITQADPAGPFGMVVVSQLGAGRVIVAGDDAIFANAAIARTDNAALLRNVLALMAAYTKST